MKGIRRGVGKGGRALGIRGWGGWVVVEGIGRERKVGGRERE